MAVSVLLLFLLATVLLLSALYIALKVVRNRNRAVALLKQLSNFRALPSVPLFGSAHLFLDTTPDGTLRTIVDCHQRYGRNLLLQELGNEFKLLTCDPRVIEQVLQAKTIVKSNFYRFLLPWIGLSSVVVSGHRWHNRRKVINPGFNYRMLQGFLSTMDAQAAVLVAKLAPHAGGPAIDVNEPLRCMAMDIICETAMGVRLGCQSNPAVPFFKDCEELLDLIYKRIFNPLLTYDLVYACTRAGRRANATIRALHQFTRSVIRERVKQMQAVIPNSQQPAPEESQEQKHRSTFLDLLLQTRLAGDELLSDDDIRGEVNTFMFAGHETVTSCLSFTLYYLSRYPDVQQRLYEEIETMARAPELTYGALMELKYTELVIRETLRLNPSVPMIGRMAAGDMEIDGVTIPTGTEVMLNIYVMQNDPQYYPDADQFRPERFLQEPPPYSYLPFSTGVRSCIGQRFAMLEMKTVLVRLLSRFRFVPCGEENALQVKANLTLKPYHGAFVKLVDRH
uniref:Cytochrome P450 n=1 Tax=Anopheles coluzzii TaxID=1518534 RepID=A0A6E8W743_ANOCL|nr:cytochrome P450 4d2-like [Anopheles coluzzii]